MANQRCTLNLLNGTVNPAGQSWHSTRAPLLVIKHLMMMQCLQPYLCPPNTGVYSTSQFFGTQYCPQSLFTSFLLHCKQRILRVVTSTPSPNANHSLPRITSFSTWLDAWNIYIATIVAHNPARGLELLGYQYLIHSATFTWLKYEVSIFAPWQWPNPLLCWDLRHSELWLDSLAIQDWVLSFIC